MTEKEFIKKLSSSYSPFGIGDDAALFGSKYLISKDIMAENVHFLKSAPINLIIKKLFTANISDIASMGGTPRSVLLGFAIDNKKDMEAIADGAKEAADFYGVNIIGGDTAESKSGLFLSLTIIGERGGNLILRKGAKKGDILYISRPTGLSKASLEKELGISDYPISPLNHYERTAEKDVGIFLGALDCVTSGADISDGIGKDAMDIAETSGVKIVIEEKNLFFPELAFLKEKAPYYAISSGEEFALIFTVKKEKSELFESEFYRRFNRYPVKIGFCEEGTGVFLKKDKEICDISNIGYEHFSE